MTQVSPIQSQPETRSDWLYRVQMEEVERVGEGSQTPRRRAWIDHEGSDEAHIDHVYVSCTVCNQHHDPLQLPGSQSPVSQLRRQRHSATKIQVRAGAIVVLLNFLLQLSCVAVEHGLALVKGYTSGGNVASLSLNLWWMLGRQAASHDHGSLSTARGPCQLSAPYQKRQKDQKKSTPKHPACYPVSRLSQANAHLSVVSFPER